MSQVGHTGSTQNAPVDYSSRAAALSGAESLDQVGKGDLDGENLRYSRQAGNNEVLKGQQLRAPVLDQPDDVKPTHLETANTDVGDISKLTEKAIKESESLLQNARNGTLTPEQQAKLKKHSSTLKDTAAFLSNVQGHNVGGAEGKRSALAALGFNQSQLDALLSMSDPDDAGNSLASLHGGQYALQGKKDALKSQGFSESQIEALLSLADPDDEGNSLLSTHQAGSGSNKAALAQLGLNAGQAERIASLLNGQTFGTQEQKELLKQMGFSEAEADVMLAAADPQSLKSQGALKGLSGADQVTQLQQLAQAANVLSTGSPVGDNVLKQLADIFMVLELLHEMSVQSRRTARETRAAEYDSAKQAVLNQAGEMRKAAAMQLVAGVVSGTMKVAAGAVTMGGAAGGGNQSAAQMQMNMQRATQISQMVSGTGDMIAAGFNYQASEHQARQKEQEAFQKTHENSAQSSSEWMQLQQDMVKTVQSKMDEIIRTWFETLKTTTRG